MRSLHRVILSLTLSGALLGCDNYGTRDLVAGAKDLKVGDPTEVDTEIGEGCREAGGEGFTEVGVFDEISNGAESDRLAGGEFERFLMSDPGFDPDAADEDLDTSDVGFAEIDSKIGAEVDDVEKLVGDGESFS